MFNGEYYGQEVSQYFDALYGNLSHDGVTISYGEVDLIGASLGGEAQQWF